MRRVAPAWLLPIVLVAGCVRPAAHPTIVVDGKRVAVAGTLTVQQALATAHVEPRSGSVLAVVTRRPLSTDRKPGLVLLDGQVVLPSSPVPPGAVLTVVPGKDVTEPLSVVTEQVPADGGFASLFVGGRPGRARVVRGALSGETVSQQVLVAPTHGHLVAPRAIALTFDDGPDPRWTPQVLALLAKAKVHATFCLVGRQVAKYPALVRAIVAGGHQLCNHTWSHDEHLAERSVARITSELELTQRAIHDATGVTPTLFRAPGGNWAPDLVAVAGRLGMAPLTWNLDPRDWARPGVRAVLGTLLATLRPGAVVLLHDGGGDRSQTVTALRVLLGMLPGRGLRYTVVLPRP